MLRRMQLDFRELVDEILDNIPLEIWKDSSKTFLDPSIGSGQFVSAIEQRLRALGATDEEIKKRVNGFESNQFRIRVAINRNNLVGNYVVKTVQDFLGSDIEFDIIVSNPPYHNPNKKASNGKIWVSIVSKAIDVLKQDGILAMIVPNTWTKGDIAPKGSGRFFRKFKDMNLIAVNNKDCSSFFPGIRVCFSYFVVQNSTYRGTTKITQDKQEISIDVSSLMFLPKDINALSIVKKMTEHRATFPCSLITNTRNHKMELGGDCPVVTNGKTIMVKDSSLYDDDNKVIVPWANHLDKCMAGRLVAGDSNIVFKTEHPQSLLEVIQSKLYRFFVLQTQTAMHNEGARFFPVVDLTQRWTADNLYTQFGLTEEEITFVERTL